jgi:dTMP kinase
VIGPGLERGAIVVCDRYLDSSLAYQGVARGLGVERVLQLNLPAIGERLPDRTFLLEIDPDESARRVGQNGDRIEREDEQFRRQVADAYRLLAETFPQRIEAVDGSRPPEEIAKEIFGRIRESL